WRSEGPSMVALAGTTSARRCSSTVFFPEGSRTILLNPVDDARNAAGAEPVVDVNDAHIRSATVQHRQQSGEPAKARTVTRARGHGNHWCCNHARYNARQRPFHPRYTNDDARLHQLLPVFEQSMQSGDSDVVDGFDPITHRPRSDERFLADRDVACTGRDDQDQPFAVDRAAAFDRNRAGTFMVYEFV